MAITLEILEQGRIVLVKFVDPWSAHEMKPLFNEDKQHRDAFMKQHPGEKVHLITDFTSSRQVANGFLQARQSPSLSHPTSGITVVVGANRLVETLARTGFRLTGYTRFHFAATVDNAVEYLKGVISETVLG